MIQKIFRMLNQYAVEIPTLPVDQCHSHLIQFLKELPSRREGPPSIWDTHGVEQDLRCQSGPSAKNSVIFSGGDSSKNYGADQQRLQISDLHFDKFPTPATFACWKIRFKTEVCTRSQFPTEAMQWIKEVEMVDSVDDF